LAVFQGRARQIGRAGSPSRPLLGSRAMRKVERNPREE
jgi:hypothetical protein